MKYCSKCLKIVKKKCNIHWHKYINIVEYETSYEFDNENKYDYWIKHFIPKQEPILPLSDDYSNIYERVMSLPNVYPFIIINSEGVCLSNYELWRNAL